MYLLMISVAFMLVGVAHMVFMHFLSKKNSMVAYVLLVVGVIGFGYSVLSVANTVKKKKKENKVLIKQKETLVGYYVEHNYSDREINRKFMKDIIKYKTQEYSKRLENKIKG